MKNRFFLTDFEEALWRGLADALHSVFALQVPVSQVIHLHVRGCYVHFLRYVLHGCY